MKQFFVICLFFLGFALLETAVLSNILVLPAIPDFILLCSLYISVQNGRTFGCVSGFAGGLILDFLTPCPFGFNSLVRTVSGYAAGFFNRTLNISGIVFPVLAGAVFTLLKYFIADVVSVLYPNVNSLEFSAAGTRIFWEFAFNALFAPVVFKFLDLFKNSLVLNSQKAM